MGRALMEAALRYAGLGMAVVPLWPKTKKPMFDKWTNIERADTNTVARWWHATPDANVGIMTGPKSGVFVLDVDPKNHGEIAYDNLTAEHGRFPDTWRQVTGTGGFHLFFRYPNFLVRNSAELFPGIDIRGDGGQVVAPPSIHPETGRSYEWDGMDEIETQPIAEAPVWLLDLLASRNEGGARGANAKQPLGQILAKIPEGVRHPTLVSVAGMLRRVGLTSDEIYPTLEIINRTRCEPPKATQVVRQIADSMMRYRPVDHELYRTASELWRLKGKAQVEQDRKMERLKIAPKDGLSVYRSELQGPADLIERMLHDGLTILAGKPKSGKSFIALQLSISVALGTLALGGRAVTRPGGVVYYSLEMGENRTADRMRKLLEQEQVSLQNVDFVWDCLPMNSGGIEQLDLFLEAKKPNLVVIDTFLGFVKGQSNERGDLLRGQYSEVEKIKKLSDKHQTAILLVHHTRKSGKSDDGEAGIDLVAGTGGVTAACDAVWIFRKAPDDMFNLDITGRDVEEQSLALKFERDPLGWRIVGDAALVRQAGEDEFILKMLLDEGPMNPSKLGGKLRCSPRRAGDILVRLDREGRVAQQSSGAYRAVVGVA